MRKVILLLSLFLLVGGKTLGQASVSYYPWSGVIGISTNADKVFWFDTRVQTNSLFSSMSIDLIPLFNVSRGEIAQWYLGGGIRVNPLYRIADPNAALITVNGYSANVGVRIAPFAQHRNIKIALELSPFVRDDLEGGVLRSNFGLAYQIGKKSSRSR